MTDNQMQLDNSLAAVYEKDAKKNVYRCKNSKRIIVNYLTNGQAEIFFERGVTQYDVNNVNMIYRNTIGTIILNIPLHKLMNSDRRKVRVAAVEQVAKRIEAEGQLTPITVVKRGRKYDIRDGLHRAAAFKLLGLEMIAAVEL